MVQGPVDPCRTRPPAPRCPALAALIGTGRVRCREARQHAVSALAKLAILLAAHLWHRPCQTQRVWLEPRAGAWRFSTTTSPPALPFAARSRPPAARPPATPRALPPRTR